MITSQATSSSRILIAYAKEQSVAATGLGAGLDLTCGAGTLRDSSFIRSLAFRIAAGSNVLRVVLTVMLPSTKSRVHAMPCFSRALVIMGHACLRYTSRYLGKRVAKDDSSAKVPPALSVGLNSSIFRNSQLRFPRMRGRGKQTFHLSMSSVSHGFSLLCVEGMMPCEKSDGGDKNCGLDAKHKFGIATVNFEKDEHGPPTTMPKRNDQQLADPRNLKCCGPPLPRVFRIREPARTGLLTKGLAGVSKLANGISIVPKRLLLRLHLRSRLERCQRV